VDKLHKAGIVVMNMVGHPKHVAKGLEAGIDLICAQGGEGGGHTGDLPSNVLVPACVDVVKGHKSPLTEKPIYVIGAGAVSDGRSSAANLMWGAQAICTYISLHRWPLIECGLPRGGDKLCGHSRRHQNCDLLRPAFTCP
jgi:NAD(P)H-dependent flavin oxidoreductase YrpB (nitropropane dioxygenase family)